MRIGIPKEIEPGEKRVALTPDAALQIRKLGYSLAIESKAGEASNYSDALYEQAGVEVVKDQNELWSSVDIIMKVCPPRVCLETGLNEIALLRKEQTLIGFLYPAQNSSILEKLSQRDVTALAIDSIPRISRAQKMDALSSMANVGGYRAVVEASHYFEHFFSGQITAAGKVPPAKILVIGAGVAGLAAIGAAKNMGAIVRAFDTRPEVKEQVESMDAEFLMIDFENEEGNGEGGYAKTMSPEFIKAELALFAEQAKEVDIIITTALIPGKPAPELITEEMVATMKPGSVIVDLAAGAGGNCKLTVANEVVVRHGVTLVGYTNLPSRLAPLSSRLYASNLYHLLADLTPEKEGKLELDMEDEIIRGATVVKQGTVTWPPPPPRIKVDSKKSNNLKIENKPKESIKKEKHPLSFLLPLFACGSILLALGSVSPPDFMGYLMVFILSCFVGYKVIWGVSHSLHTPLMSVTNAISSIIVIGALTQISSDSIVITILSVLAIFVASINIIGGFAVTQRMLRMFRKQGVE